jgi:hypothetical protein
MLFQGWGGFRAWTVAAMVARYAANVTSGKCRLESQPVKDFTAVP